jgi:CRISPR-associated protein Cst2
MSNNNGNLRDNLKAITFTIIFEASALNRDEKLGGNIPSIKKLTRFGNKTFSYLSRVAMRHYLFETLYKSFPNYWSLTPTYESGSGDNKVVQFDLKQANILTYAELDVFGYMFTEKNKVNNNTENVTMTRKAALGITKAVALETWEGDMQFNANHDIASRCGANPNPVNKEEQKSYFKVSFTIDVDKLGCDEWQFKELKYDPVKQELTLEFPAGLKIVIANANVDHQNNSYDVSGFGSIESNNTYRKATFIVAENIKKTRICQLLEVLKNGLVYHTSGENYGIVPLFIIAAGLKLPIPLFNSFVELGSFESSILDNAYILCEKDKRLVYVYNPKNLAGHIDTSELYTDWDEFLRQLGVKQ